jgi:hypothetical protein
LESQLPKLLIPSFEHGTILLDCGDGDVGFVIDDGDVILSFITCGFADGDGPDGTILSWICSATNGLESPSFEFVNLEKFSVITFIPPVCCSRIAFFSYS